MLTNAIKLIDSHENLHAQYSCGSSIVLCQTQWIKIQINIKLILNTN